MKLIDRIQGNDAVKAWLFKHGKFDVLNMMVDQMRSSGAKLCIMPLMTDTHWAMAHRFQKPDDSILLDLVLCDRRLMSQLEFISCCVQAAQDNGVVIEPGFIRSRNDRPERPAK